MCSASITIKIHLADVLYSIFMPILTRKTFATLFDFATVLCFEMVKKLYCNKDYHISFNLTCLSLRSKFLVDSISRGDKVPARPSNT